MTSTWGPPPELAKDTTPGLIAAINPALNDPARKPAEPTIVINTLGKMRRYQMGLTVYCAEDDCGHGSRLNLDYLCERLGEDHGCLAADMKVHFRCQKCGGRKVTFRTGPAMDKAQALASAHSHSAPSPK
jgi:hypothetical protein